MQNLLLPEFPKSRSHEIILLSKDDPSSYIFERAKKDPRIAVMTRNWLFKNNLHFPTILSLTLEIIGDMDKISRYLWIDKAIKACQNDPKDTTALIEKCLIRYIENLKSSVKDICTICHILLFNKIANIMNQKLEEELIEIFKHTWYQQSLGESNMKSFNAIISCVLIFPEFSIIDSFFIDQVLPVYISQIGSGKSQKDEAALWIIAELILKSEPGRLHDFVKNTFQIDSDLIELIVLTIPEDLKQLFQMQSPVAIPRDGLRWRDVIVHPGLDNSEPLVELLIQGEHAEIIAQLVCEIFDSNFHCLDAVATEFKAASNFFNQTAAFSLLSTQLKHHLHESKEKFCSVDDLKNINYDDNILEYTWKSLLVMCWDFHVIDKISTKKKTSDKSSASNDLGCLIFGWEYLQYIKVNCIMQSCFVCHRFKELKPTLMELQGLFFPRKAQASFNNLLIDDASSFSKNFQVLQSGILFCLKNADESTELLKSWTLVKKFGSFEDLCKIYLSLSGTKISFRFTEAMLRPALALNIPMDSYFSRFRVRIMFDFLTEALFSSRVYLSQQAILTVFSKNSSSTKDTLLQKADASILSCEASIIHALIDIVFECARKELMQKYESIEKFFQYLLDSCTLCQSKLPFDLYCAGFKEILVRDDRILSLIIHRGFPTRHLNVALEESTVGEKSVVLLVSKFSSKFLVIDQFVKNIPNFLRVLERLVVKKVSSLSFHEGVVMICCFRHYYLPEYEDFLLTYLNFIGNIFNYEKQILTRSYLFEEINSAGEPEGYYIEDLWWVALLLKSSQDLKYEKVQSLSFELLNKLKIYVNKSFQTTSLAYIGPNKQVHKIHPTVSFYRTLLRSLDRALKY